MNKYRIVVREVVYREAVVDARDEQHARNRVDEITEYLGWIIVDSDDPLEIMSVTEVL